MKKKTLGRLGELIAKRFVVKKLGFEFVISNLQTKFGEIDLLFFDSPKNTFVVVEVRTRTSPLFDIDKTFPRRKLNRLKGLCSFVEMKYDKLCRLDLVFVQIRGKTFRVKYFKDVLELM